MYTLIETAKLNDVDRQTWLAHVLANIAGTTQNLLDNLLPWNWKSPPEVKAACCGSHRTLTSFVLT